MSGEIPVPPDWYEGLKDGSVRLEQLRLSQGYREYCASLVGELTRIFFEFLTAKGDDLIRLQGQGQSVQRILGILDEQLVQRTQVAAAVDAQMEAIRQGRSRHAAPAEREQPAWRSLDHAMLGR